MALTPSQKDKLFAVLRESVVPDPDSIALINELWLGYFETGAQRMARAQGWVAAVRAKRQAERDAADAQNTARKAVLDAELAALDTINANV